ncbi:tRNA (uracil-5-)-methyltransferase homolog A [Vanessa tameamea]|uniref:tRNA (uracil(54)-C(5))-methyltransferase n=1 Tax=Vanessa tameamea TaxID=334116 RepID=A0A8B8IVW6_VANTA
MSETNETVTEIKLDSEIQETPSISEEYAYLDRGGFSSEKFKIELRGMPKFYGIAELKKLMNQKLGLNTSKIKRPKNGSHWLYACFQNDEERTKAISVLNGYLWKGKTLIAEEAKPAPDPLVRKRKQEEDASQIKKKKENENKSQEERLKDAVTPFWNIPYEEQLKLKEKEIKNLLMKFDNEVWKVDKGRRREIESNRKLHKGLSFELIPIEKSPITEGYRNKCEFTVGIDDETQKPTVGFRLGSYVTGTVGVAPIMGLNHISEKTKKAVLLFQEFVRKSSMAPFSPADFSGYWRYLTVRESSYSGEIMLIIAMHPQNLSAEELDELSKQLVAHFSSEEAVVCGVKSLYFEVIRKRRVGEDASKPTHLMGSTHITDSILGLQFRISAEAFFQINTAGAGVLYARAVALSAARRGDTALDICCGTGTIGLCFAQHCNKVLGLELVAEAVKDAKANAELNNIENCEFFTGKAEDILPSVLARAPGDDIIAIVDPPRAGLHMRAITQLRNTEKVKRLLYMSCSPAAAIKNFVDLTRPSSKTLRGAPFVPVRAVPVDMFPHTKHVELLILFQREDASNSKVSTEASEAQNNMAETSETTTEASEAIADNVETSQLPTEASEVQTEVVVSSEAQANVETSEKSTEKHVSPDNVVNTNDDV